MGKRIFRFLPFMTPIILNPWIGCILRSFPSKRRMRSERWRVGRSLRVRSWRLQLQRSLSLLSIQIYPSKLPNLSRPSLLERPSLSLHLPRCLYLQQRSSLLHMSLLKLSSNIGWIFLKKLVLLVHRLRSSSWLVITNSTPSRIIWTGIRQTSLPKLSSFKGASLLNSSIFRWVLPPSLINIKPPPQPIMRRWWHILV